jgi:tetraacyldisaccharide 4'-kinase
LHADKFQALSTVDGKGEAVKQRELQDFAGRRVWMVAGIGNPERFARLLRSADIQTDVVPVPDHGRVSLEQLRHRQPQPILMTEKDAVKYSDFADGEASVPDCWYLPVEVVFDTADQEAILAKVNQVLNKFEQDGKRM